jgi:hypothetical protein
MANCLKCGAKCAVHSLCCEKDVMKDKDSIDCTTFIEGTKPTDSTMTAFVVLRELERRGMLPQREFRR